MKTKNNQVVINFFGGPCSGKSTIASELFSFMKKQGYNVELALEYAKDLVYGKQENILKTSQVLVFAKQQYRIDRLLDSDVQYVITDSPILLSIFYSNYTEDEGKYLFEDFVLQQCNQYNSVNIFIERGSEYQEQGRLQKKTDAIRIDTNIKDILSKNGISYIEVTQTDQLSAIVEKILK